VFTFRVVEKLLEAIVINMLNMYDKQKRKDDLSCFKDICMLLRKCDGFAILFIKTLYIKCV
jgi:hypothetical protein